MSSNLSQDRSSSSSSSDNSTVTYPDWVNEDAASANMTPQQYWSIASQQGVGPTANNRTDTLSYVRQHAGSAMGGGSTGSSGGTTTPVNKTVAVDPNQNLINTGAYVLNQNAQYPVFGQANTKSGVGPSGTNVTSKVPDKPTASWASAPGLLGGVDQANLNAGYKGGSQITPTTPPTAAAYNPGTPMPTVSYPTPSTNNVGWNWGNRTLNSNVSYTTPTTEAPAAPGGSTNTAMTVGQYGAKAGGGVSDYASRFGSPTASTGNAGAVGATAGGSATGGTPGMTGMQKMQLANYASDQMDKFNKMGQQTQQAIKNVSMPQNAIPGPEQFQNRGNPYSLSAFYV